MHHVLAVRRRRLVDEMRVQRRLAVVDVPFGQDADRIVGV
jgi:hypothetical protein